VCPACRRRTVTHATGALAEGDGRGAVPGRPDRHVACAAWEDGETTVAGRRVRPFDDADDSDPPPDDDRRRRGAGPSLAGDGDLGAISERDVRVPSIAATFDLQHTPSVPHEQPLVTLTRYAAQVGRADRHAADRGH